MVDAQTISSVRWVLCSAVGTRTYRSYFFLLNVAVQNKGGSMQSRRLTLLCSLLLLFSLAITACGGSASTSSTSSGSVAPTGGCTGKISNGPYTLTAWFHAGIGAERDVWKDQVARFNSSQNLVKVNAIT
jgi:hypothetical protein